MLTEGGREGGLTGVAYTICHLGNVNLLFSKQAGGLFHANVLDAVVDSEARHLLHLAVQMGPADASLGTDKADIKVAIADVVVDALHDAFHKKFVITFHLNIPDVLVYPAGIAVDDLNSRLNIGG